MQDDCSFESEINASTSVSCRSFRAKKNEWNTKMWVHSVDISAFLMQVSLKWPKRTFFLLFKVQQTFELKTVEINSSNGMGFFSMETVEEICLYPISHFMLCKLFNLEAYSALGDAQVESNMQHMTWPKASKQKRALWCDGSECLCSQSLINHGTTQECVTNRCAFTFCYSLSRVYAYRVRCSFVYIHYTQITQLRRSLMCFCF